MTDDELFGNTPVPAQSAPAPVAAPQSAPAAIPPLPAETDAELLARTAIAEGDKGNPQSWQNIAGVVLNRAAKSGQSVASVIAQPGQFEAYGNGHIQAVDKTSPQFQAALQAIQPVIAGQVKVPYDSFYQPQIVAQRGVKPPFDPSQGTKIGSQLFGTGYQTPSNLTPEDQAAWNSLYGDQVPPITDAKGNTKGLPSDPQADTAEYLTLHGFRDPDATPGSSTNPAAQMKDGTIPTNPGDWYIAQGGQLRQVGSDTPDYLPGYKSVVANRATAASAPGVNRFLTGVGQGVTDVAGSINKLTGGGLGVGDPMTAALAQTQGGPSAFDLAQQSKAGFDQERNAYDLLHHGDPVAAGGRFTGQVASTAPALALGGEALGAAGPAGEFLAGGSEAANPLIQGVSRAAGGALQGGGASALTSETSDRPVAEQIAGGALAGGVAGTVVPAAANALVGGVKSVLGADAISPAVASLANLAVNKYGINLRGSQIAGVADRATAIRDSNLLSEPGSGFAANNESQRAAFTKAVGDTFGGDGDGAPVTALTPQTMQGAKTRIGSVFNRVGQNTTIADTDPLMTNLGQVAHDAAQVLPDSDVRPILNQIQNIASTTEDGKMSGASYLSLTKKGSPLDQAQNSANPNIRYYAGQVRDALDDALEANASPEDLADLQNARFQYKNLMTIQGLAAKAGVEGTISPTLLNGAVNTSFKNRAFSGAGDLGELAQIGQTFMKEPPNSGTASRLFDLGKRNVIPALIGGGALGELPFLHDPGLALKLGMGAAAAKIVGMGTTAASGLRNGPMGANLLLRGAQPSGVVGNALLNGVDAGRSALAPLYIPGAAIAGNPLLAQPSAQ